MHVCLCMIMCPCACVSVVVCEVVGKPGACVYMCVHVCMSMRRWLCAHCLCMRTCLCARVFVYENVSMCMCVSGCV